MRRRHFLRSLGALPLALTAACADSNSNSSSGSGTGRPASEPTSGPTEGSFSDERPLFQVSLAEWSLNKAIRSGKLAHLDFPKAARAFELDAVEYVSTLFKDASTAPAYIGELKTRCKNEGVQSLLIMVDGEGYLGDPDSSKRGKAVKNHHRWVDAAAELGCHSIRVNAESAGSYDEQMKLAAEGLSSLAEYADGRGLNVIVENHGRLSSNGAWLSGVMKKADHPRVGTLPDFGNFRISKTESYDRYQGVTELMPFAKAVSAKSYHFEDGRETTIDFERMMKIVVDAGYRGYVGIEYEGQTMSEDDGIRATRDLLVSVRKELAAR